MSGVHSSTGASMRQAAAGCALMLGLLAAASARGQGEPVGQAGNVWNLGQLVAGKRYPTTVTAVNRNCRGKHNFQLEVDAGASAFLRIEGHPVAERLGPGQSKTLPAVVDLSAVAPGTFDRGHLVTRCLDCPPSCQLDYMAINIRMTVVAPSATPTPEPAMRPEEERREPQEICGPDVGHALDLAMARMNLRKLDLPPGAVVDFRKRETLLRTPFRMIAEVVPFCPTPASRSCSDTVWLWGRCVDAAVPEWILEGYARWRFRHNGLFPPRLEPAGGDPWVGSPYQRAVVYGVGRARDHRLGLDELFGILAPPGVEILDPKLCRPCGMTAFGFTVDASKDVWVLTDGSYVFFRE